MSRPLFVLAACALSLVAGCTTVAPEQRAATCANTDWHRYGVNDGTMGVPASERAAAFSDCAEVGQPVDVSGYEAGRSEGLTTYCTAQHGYEIGYRGRRYQDVCPAELEPDFLQGLAQGRNERPGGGIYPSIGIGIGSGGRVRTGVGVGIGIGGFYSDDYYRDRYVRDPFPSSWRRHTHYGCGPFGRSGCW